MGVEPPSLFAGGGIDREYAVQRRAEVERVVRVDGRGLKPGGITGAVDPRDFEFGDVARMYLVEIGILRAPGLSAEGRPPGVFLRHRGTCEHAQHDRRHGTCEHARHDRRHGTRQHARYDRRRKSDWLE